MEWMQKSPVRNYKNLITQYVELISEYLVFSCEAHTGPIYKNRKKEMEKTLIQMGGIIKCREGRSLGARYYLIPFNKAMHKIDLNKTRYIYSKERKVIFVQDSGSIFETYGKLEDIWSEISQYAAYFCRISKSYVINLFYADSFESSSVRIGNQIFNISKKYFNQALDRTTILQCLCADGAQQGKGQQYG